VFTPSKPQQQWSKLGLNALVISIIMMAALSIVDGIVKGPLRAANGADPTLIIMFSTWVTDFRYFFEQGIYAATVLFVGAKFFETRTIFTIGFDKVDAEKMSIKGPDENNVVWVGHRYGSPLEAESIANALAERLKESAAA
jgi:hypothetical protein